MLPVTAFFAGILALIYVALSIHVIAGRYKHKVALGDGGQKAMHYRIRAHANFAEYVPLALILLGVNELNHVSPTLLQWMGGLLVFGRLMHAFSLIRVEIQAGKIIFRQIGMACTFTAIIVLALLALD